METAEVYIYMMDWFPCTDGSGTNNRLYSNLRSYVDNGLRVEVVCLRSRSDWQAHPDPSLLGVTYTEVPVARSSAYSPSTWMDRVCYLFGSLSARGLNYRFKHRKLLQKEVLKRENRHPRAWHHFEYISCASSLIGLKGIHSAWSHHDMESSFQEGHMRIRSQLEGKQPTAEQLRGLRWLKQAERAAAQEASVVLCIAKHEAERMRREWALNQVELFPMSLPDESVPKRTQSWAEGGSLRLLHLGRIDSLPSFRSLEFLLGEVFPALPQRALDRIELVIVGEVRDTERGRRIQALAAPFKAVRFEGFQKDIRKYYGSCDLQVVGSLEATGLRTRIIESFAYGVPVLSTTTGAEGVAGLMHGANILLADTPTDYASQLVRLLEAPSRLLELSSGGTHLYQENYSRRAVARDQARILDKYWKR